MPEQSNESTSKRRVVLFKVEEDLADELSEALRQEGIAVQPEFCSSLQHVQEAAPDLVFSGFSADLANILLAIGAPVVVVTRHPEANQYLDAMDAGATDYCASPFEPHHLRWLLQKPHR